MTVECKSHVTAPSFEHVPRPSHSNFKRARVPTSVLSSPDFPTHDECHPVSSPPVHFSLDSVRGMSSYNHGTTVPLHIHIERSQEGIF